MGLRRTEKGYAGLVLAAALLLTVAPPSYGAPGSAAEDSEPAGQVPAEEPADAGKAAADRRGGVVVNGRFTDNTFISTGAGVDVSYTPGLGLGFNAKGTFVMDVSAGKWFTPNVGFRVGYQGLNYSDWESEKVLLPGANAEPARHGGKDLYRVRTEYDYLHADLLWNASNALLGYSKERMLELIPYAHIGYEWLYNSFTSPRTWMKCDYSAGAGLIASLRLTGRISAYADLRALTAVRHTRDTRTDEEQMGLSFYGIAGLSYDLGRTDWSRKGGNDRSGYILNGLTDNTFIRLEGGMDGYFVLGESMPFNADPRNSWGISAGKWLTPAVGLRLGVRRSTLSHYAETQPDHNRFLTVDTTVFRGIGCQKYSFGFTSIHGDLLWNMFNTFGDYKPSRFYSVIPYASFAFGLSDSFTKDVIFRRDFMMGAGLVNEFRLCRFLSLDVDLNAYYMSKRRYGNTNRHDAFIAGANFGAKYDIDNTPWTRTRRATVRKPVRNTREAYSGPVIRGLFSDNTFISLFTGANFNVAGDGVSFAPGMEISAGKWLTTTAGLRLGLAGLNGNEDGSETGFYFPHADLLISLNGTSRGSKKGHAGDDAGRGRRTTIAPYVGVGYMFSASRDNSYPEFGTMGAGVDAGVTGSVAVGERAMAHLDLRATCLRNITTFSPMVGLTYHIGSPGWLIGHNAAALAAGERTENAGKVMGYILNRGFFDNTFISYTAGVNSLDLDGAAMAVDISAGKWLTPSLGLRAGYQGRKTVRNSGRDCTKLNLDFYHADFLWNPLTSFSGVKQDRRFTPALYLQAGVMDFRSPNGPRLDWEPTAGAGALLSWRVDERLALTADLKASVVDDRYTGEPGTAIHYGALAGVSYAFGRTGWEPGLAYDPEALRGDDRARPWALSTNLLGYADLLTLNLELQYAVNRHWSLSMQGRTNGLIVGEGTEEQMMDRRNVSTVGVKYWPWYVYCGLWAKAFLQTEGYSRSNLTKEMGFQLGDAYGAGTAVGYSLIINKWFNIDFGAGLWAGYRTCDEFAFPRLDAPVKRSGRPFVDLAELSLSAMFIF